MSLATTEKEVRLDKSEDWEVWYNQLERFTRGKKVWIYLDPDEKEPPALVKLKPLKKDVTAAEVDNQRVANKEYDKLEATLDTVNV